jgi:hypothetical protein
MEEHTSIGDFEYEDDDMFLVSPATALEQHRGRCRGEDPG